MLVDEAQTRSYNLRYRVCEAHLRAEAVVVKGATQRFCQARYSLVIDLRALLARSRHD